MKPLKTIKQNYSIDASSRRVWKALTDPKVIAKWGAGPCKMTEEVGFRFSLWGGSIFGKNIKVEKNKLLSQEWYGGKWDQPSVVTFNLIEKDNKTKVTLVQVDVPDYDEKNIKKGWKDYYMNPLKNLLEGK